MLIKIPDLNDLPSTHKLSSTETALLVDHVLNDLGLDLSGAKTYLESRRKVALTLLALDVPFLVMRARAVHDDPNLELLENAKRDMDENVTCDVAMILTALDPMLDPNTHDDLMRRAAQTVEDDVRLLIRVEQGIENVNKRIKTEVTK